MARNQNSLPFVVLYTVLMQNAIDDVGVTFLYKDLSLLLVFLSNKEAGIFVD